MLGFTIIAMAGPIAVEPPNVPSFFTGEQIYRICQKPDDGQCLMYVAGALDGIFFVRFTDGTTKLCPRPMSNREAAEILVTYLTKRPEARRLAAAAAAREALSPKIECAANATAVQQ